MTDTSQVITDPDPTQVLERQFGDGTCPACVAASIRTGSMWSCSKCGPSHGAPVATVDVCTRNVAPRAS